MTNLTLEKQRPLEIVKNSNCLGKVDQTADFRKTCLDFFPYSSWLLKLVDLLTNLTPEKTILKKKVGKKLTLDIVDKTEAFGKTYPIFPTLISDLNVKSNLTS